MPAGAGDLSNEDEASDSQSGQDKRRGRRGGHKRGGGRESRKVLKVMRQSFRNRCDETSARRRKALRSGTGGGVTRLKRASTAVLIAAREGAHRRARARLRATAEAGRFRTPCSAHQGSRQEEADHPDAKSHESSNPHESAPIPAVTGICAMSPSAFKKCHRQFIVHEILSNSRDDPLEAMKRRGHRSPAFFRPFFVARSPPRSGSGRAVASCPPIRF